MAAPRDSVYHFLKLSYEKNQTLNHKLVNKINSLNTFNGENKLVMARVHRK